MNVKDQILSELSQLDVNELVKIYFSYRSWINRTNTVTATPSVQPTTTQTKKKRTGTSTRKRVKTASTTVGSQPKEGTFTATVVGALTTEPKKAAEVATKLFETGAIPSLDRKNKARISVLLSQLAQRNKVLKTGSMYSMPF